MCEKKKIMTVKNVLIILCNVLNNENINNVKIVSNNEAIYINNVYEITILVLMANGNGVK